MKFARRALAFAAFVFAALGATSAQAVIQRWTFQQVTFQDLRDPRSGALLDGGTLTGFFQFDTDRQRINSWNIFTSPGWMNCNDPTRGYVCYTEGLHWTQGNSRVNVAPFMQLVREERDLSALLNLFLRPIPGTLAFKTFDFSNSGETIVDDSVTSQRRIVSGYASLLDTKSH